uniref:Derlin n=1 Tax=Arcella intermedia TaxID=1963864 RepID=A0A6B2LID1_9EUKA
MLPPITRVLFTASLAVTGVVDLGLLDPMWLILHKEAILFKYEIWRLVTPFLFYRGWTFINIFFLGYYGSFVERDIFKNERADYFWMIVLGCIMLYIPGFLIPLYTLENSLLMMIIYYWSRIYPDLPMCFFTFQSKYLPWVLIGFNIIIGNIPIDYICGVCVGHIYFFLAVFYPTQGGPRWLSTPQFLTACCSGTISPTEETVEHSEPPIVITETPA